MKICRFTDQSSHVQVGLISDDGHVIGLHGAGVEALTPLLEAPDLPRRLTEWAGRGDLPRHAPNQIRLLPPLERQEVWAAGVTYLRSKKARMEESEFSASAYDRVYAAERPELFFKALPEKAVGTGELVGIRKDARWSVPEPELTFVINSGGTLVGFTIGNDMSSRDIEGENSLYLPQAKVYERSCALGPCIRVGVTENEARGWGIRLGIERQGTIVFEGATSAAQIKRSFAELVEYLFRSQKFPHGVVLLTGTGIVPPDEFTLQAEDVVRIDIDGIGQLENRVIVV